MAEATTRTLQRIAPRALLHDRNIRHGNEEDKKLIASLKADGLLQPIVAVRTADGDFRVRFGHRRTVCSIAAGLETVLVDVIGDEATDSPAEIERIVTQYAENTFRKGLTKGEEVDVVEQLSLLGMSATAIAKRLGETRPMVKDALAVAKSPLAKTAADRYDLDLAQAAVVAEFEENPERVKALVAAAQIGQFDHVAARIRQDVADEAEAAELAAKLEAEGLRVVPEPKWGDKTTRRLNGLYDEEKNLLDPAKHARCPGHVVWVTEGMRLFAPDGSEVDPEDPELTEEALAEAEERHAMVPEFGCDQAAELHPHSPWQTRTAPAEPAAEVDEAERQKAIEAAEEEARVQRRRVREGNKAWDAAVSVRRAWLRDLLKRKTAPAGAARFVTEATIRGDHAVRRAFERSHPLASELFGVEGAAGPNKYGFGARTGDLLTLLDGASDKRLNGITLGLLLAAYEDGLDRDSWRGNVSATNSRYLQFLADNGYPLCDVERLAAGLPPTEVASSENSKEESGEVQRESA